MRLWGVSKKNIRNRLHLKNNFQHKYPLRFKNIQNFNLDAVL